MNEDITIKLAKACVSYDDDNQPNEMWFAPLLREAIIEICNLRISFANLPKEITWQPKETLIKDNARKLLMLTNGYPVFAYWEENCEFGQFITRPGWQVFECEDPFYSWGVEDHEVAHWAPEPTNER